MSWRLVDGVALPDAVAGHPALDFCNTRAGWGTSRPKEYLVSTRALILWTRRAGLLGDLPDPLPHGSRDVLDRALALREALYPVALGRGTAADWAVVSDEAYRARAGQRLAPAPARQGSGPSAPCARWTFDLTLGLELAIVAVADAAVTLLVSPLAAATAACPGEGCGWLFADPRRRRRWCSMAVCGNRAKARRFTARHPA